MGWQRLGPTFALLSSWPHMGWQRRLARKSMSASDSCGSGGGAGGSAAVTETREAGSDSSPATIVGTVTSDELGPESDDTEAKCQWNVQTVLVNSE